MTQVEILKELRFIDTTQLVAYLQKSGLTWKADKETERIYILDATKARNQSTEFEIKENKSGYFYLSEVRRRAV